MISLYQFSEQPSPLDPTLFNQSASSDASQVSAFITISNQSQKDITISLPSSSSSSSSSSLYKLNNQCSKRLAFQLPRLFLSDYYFTKQPLCLMKKDKNPNQTKRDQEEEEEEDQDVTSTSFLIYKIKYKRSRKNKIAKKENKNVNKEVRKEELVWVRKSAVKPPRKDRILEIIIKAKNANTYMEFASVLSESFMLGVEGPCISKARSQYQLLRHIHRSLPLMWSTHQEIEDTHTSTLPSSLLKSIEASSSTSSSKILSTRQGSLRLLDLIVLNQDEIKKNLNDFTLVPYDSSESNNVEEEEEDDDDADNNDEKENNNNIQTEIDVKIKVNDKDEDDKSIENKTKIQDYAAASEDKNPPSHTLQCPVMTNLVQPPICLNILAMDNEINNSESNNYEEEKREGHSRYSRKLKKSSQKNNKTTKNNDINMNKNQNRFINITLSVIDNRQNINNNNNNNTNNNNNNETSSNHNLHNKNDDDNDGLSLLSKGMKIMMTPMVRKITNLPLIEKEANENKKNDMNDMNDGRYCLTHSSYYHVVEYADWMTMNNDDRKNDSILNRDNDDKKESDQTNNDQTNKDNGVIWSGQLTHEINFKQSNNNQCNINNKNDLKGNDLNQQRYDMKVGLCLTEPGVYAIGAKCDYSFNTNDDNNTNKQTTRKEHVPTNMVNTNSTTKTLLSSQPLIIFVRGHATQMNK